MKDFQQEVKENIDQLGEAINLQKKGKELLIASAQLKYSYNFAWLGRPIIQYPQDIVAMQEIIWEVKPDLIVETGIAHGGSLVFSASMLAMLDIQEAIEHNQTINPSKSSRKVLGIDIDIRSHNRESIEAHPMSSRIQMLEGSSIDPNVIAQVENVASNHHRILVCLDSNHTHDHVAAELDAYANLATPGSYCVVFDTVVDDMPDTAFPDRPWGPGNNPKTAVRQYLAEHPEFKVDKQIDNKLLLSVAPEGYLKRIS